MKPRSQNWADPEGWKLEKTRIREAVNVIRAHRGGIAVTGAAMYAAEAELTNLMGWANQARQWSRGRRLRKLAAICRRSWAPLQVGPIIYMDKLAQAFCPPAA